MPRRKRTLETVQIQKTMSEAGVYGAKLIRDVLRGKDSQGRKMPKVSMTKVRAAIEAVAHGIGYPKQKVDIKTDALTMQEIAEIASTFGQDDSVLTVPLTPKSAVKVGDNAKN